MSRRYISYIKVPKIISVSRHVRGGVRLKSWKSTLHSLSGVDNRQYGVRGEEGRGPSVLR